ncbi:MAG TPA: hypothetical protein PLC04_04270 [Candidatus Kapabacteria bacterium]|nr:hypothetical protein [Candidatus Kapabacteria bacterium]
MEDISYYKKTEKKLSATKRKMYLLDALAGLFIAIGTFALATTIFSVLEHFGNFSSAVRLVFYGLIWLSAIVPFGIFSVPSLLKLLGISKSIQFDELALRIGWYYPDVQDRLSNSLQLVSRSKSLQGISRSLIEASFQEAYKASEGKDFNVIIDKKKFQRSLFYMIGALLLTVVIFATSSNSLFSAMNRIQNWNTSYTPPAPYTLKIQPKYQKILKNSNLRITVKADGVPPESIKLYVKEEASNEYDSYTLQLDTSNTYNYYFTNIKSTFEFYAEADWLGKPVRTDTGKIVVYDKPEIRSINGEVHFPSYTHISPRPINEQNGDITALRGSQVNFQISANKELRSAKIYFLNSTKDSTTKKDTSVISLAVNKNTASGSMSIINSGSYYFKVYDKNNEENEQPVQYGVIVMQDEYPAVRLIQPMYNVKLTDDAILPMQIGITDDYGFSYLKLYYRLAYSEFSEPDKEFRSVKIPIIYNGLSVEIPFVWNLKQLDIVPNDRYEFFVEVADNDIISGPKTARSQILTAILPSLEDVLTENESKQENIQQDINKLTQEVSDIKKDAENLQRDLQKNPNQKQLNWEQQKKAEDILKRQEKVMQKMEDLQKQLSQSTQEMNQNKLISQETLQKYLELQKLMKEINSPELQKLQNKIQEALKNISKEDMEKALKNFTFNEEQFKQSIERTMKILQRLQLEQKIDALNRRAEKLQESQEELKNQANQKNLSKEQQQDIAKKQEQLQKEVQSIDKELQEIEKLMNKVQDEDMPKAELKDAEQALQSENTQEQMQEASEQMQKGNQNKASNSMQKASKNLADFKQKMQKLRDEMAKRSSEEAIRQMQKAVSDMMEVSKDQEQLLEKLSKIDYNSALLPQLGQAQQKNFENLMRIAQRLSELSEKSFGVTPQMAEEISSALQNMNEAMENFTDRKIPNITKSQKQALGDINSALAQMQEMLSQMKKSNGSCPNPGGSGQPQQGSGGNSGFSQRLQQLAAQQQAINEMMRQMMEGNGKNGQNGNISPEAQSQYQRLQMDQTQAQKTIDQMLQEQKQFSTPEGQKLKSELLDLQKEMKENIEDVKQNGVRPEALKRQERIMVRLLDLYNSTNERDFENRRESRSGGVFNLQSPDEIDFSNQETRKAIIDDIMKQSEKDYTIDYRNLIKSYFEQLDKKTQ